MKVWTNYCEMIKITKNNSMSFFLQNLSSNFTFAITKENKTYLHKHKYPTRHNYQISRLTITVMQLS